MALSEKIIGEDLVEEHLEKGKNTCQLLNVTKELQNY